jgi:hypothetical protein
MRRIHVFRFGVLVSAAILAFASEAFRPGDTRTLGVPSYDQSWIPTGTCSDHAVELHVEITDLSRSTGKSGPASPPGLMAPQTLGRRLCLAADVLAGKVLAEGGMA